MEDCEGANKALSKAHSLAPQDPLVLINYAVILEITGHRDRATEILSELNDIAAVIDVEGQVSTWLFIDNNGNSTNSILFYI